MSSESTSAAKAIETSDIRTLAVEIDGIDASIAAQSTKLGATIRELLAVCAASFGRKCIHPKLKQDCNGEGESADWAGIKFAGGRKQSHGGQGGKTWQWYIHGNSYYITSQGRVYSIEWDGEATDFSGSKGYMDTYSSEVDCEELEQHLDYCPESAEEIIDALRKLVTEDKRARQTIQAEIAAVIARLR